MWFTGAAEISRKKRFTLKKIKKNVAKKDQEKCRVEFTCFPLWK